MERSAAHWPVTMSNRSGLHRVSARIMLNVSYRLVSSPATRVQVQQSASLWSSGKQKRCRSALVHQVKPHTCNSGVLLIQGFLRELERWQCGDVQTPAARHRSVHPDTAASLEPQRQDRPETRGLRLPVQYVFNTDIPLDNSIL